MKKLIAITFLVVSLGASADGTLVVAPNAAVSLAAGGLAREERAQVVQFAVDGVTALPLQFAYTAWRDSRAVSLLYAWRGKYFEAGAGIAHASGGDASAFRDDHAAVHLRVGIHAAPFFVSYEAIAVQGETVAFLLGGVRFDVR